MTFKEARALEGTFQIYHLGNIWSTGHECVPLQLLCYSLYITDALKQHTRMQLAGGQLHIGDRIGIGSSRIKILEVR